MNIATKLLALPAHERQLAVTDYLIDTFRPSLLMNKSEEIPLDVSLFELGINSLQAQNLRYTLEDELGCRFDTAELYSRPTLSKLSSYVYNTLFKVENQEVDTSLQLKNRSMVDALLTQL